MHNIRVHTSGWKLCLREKDTERKTLKERIQILICVAKTKAELFYLLDFNLALSEETVRERHKQREKRKPNK